MSDWLKKLPPAALLAAGHMTGVVVLAALGAALFFDAATLQLCWVVWREGTLASELVATLAAHLAVAATVWALVALLWTRWRGQSRQSRRVPRLMLERGSVFIETLVVFPVALLLIFGLAQLAVVNMAGVFTNLATFQASRAAWLWHGEADRFGVDSSEIEAMARVQAAAVLTPVVPGMSVGVQNDLPTDAEAARRMRGLLVGTQLPVLSNNLDVEGRAYAARSMSVQQSHGASFVEAFDSDSFRDRSVRKYSLAYQSVDVNWIDAGDEVGVRIEYKHQCVFPLVAGIFGTRDSVAGINGYYVSFERKFMRRPQLQANGEWPSSDEWDHGQPIHTVDFF
jgi:hypothetical protein